MNDWDRDYSHDFSEREPEPLVGGPAMKVPRCRNHPDQEGIAHFLGPEGRIFSLCSDCLECRQHSICPICASVESKPYSGDYQKCIECGIIFLNHPPSPMPKESPDAEMWKAIPRVDHLRRVWHLLEFLGHEVKQVKRCVDFGSGIGSFAKAIQHTYGCQVCGVDTDPAAVSAASKHGVPSVAHLDMVAWESCDLIVCLHTLEHLAKPMEVLATFHRLLGSDGNLLIEVPNMRCTNALRPDHALAFTPDTFYEVLDRANMDILKYDEYSLPVTSADPRNLLVLARPR